MQTTDRQRLFGQMDGLNQTLKVDDLFGKLEIPGDFKTVTIAGLNQNVGVNRWMGARDPNPDLTGRRFPGKDRRICSDPVIISRLSGIDMGMRVATFFHGA